MNIEDKIQQISVQTIINSIPTQIIMGLNLYGRINKDDDEIKRIILIGNNFCNTFKYAQRREFNIDECEPNLYLGFLKIFSSNDKFNRFEPTINQLEKVLIIMNKEEDIESTVINKLRDELTHFSNNASIYFIDTDTDPLDIGLSV